ncbi:dirigent protein 22-like [Coffea arabica]|nr:dirigent protein 22-like [Coffea arabica]
MTMAPQVHGQINPEDQSPKVVELWLKKLGHVKHKKLTKLHFYFHDTLSGNNPTAVEVAQANITSKSPTLFGIVNVMDDPLTVGPEPASKIVGFAQGFYASASQQDVGLLMTLNFVFTDGKYNGSTLSILGQNHVFHNYRELPILGGSGVFRLARGIATAKTYAFNATTGDAIVEYHVIVMHY